MTEMQPLNKFNEIQLNSYSEMREPNSKSTTGEKVSMTVNHFLYSFRSKSLLILAKKS